MQRSCVRMQFIFLYYDQNRNGRLEVEEAPNPLGFAVRAVDFVWYGSGKI